MTSELFLGERTLSERTLPRVAKGQRSAAQLDLPSSRLIPFSVPDPADLTASSSHAITLFDLRQSIMRYTNPLRAKILLFSLLYSSQTQATETAAMVKSHRLDQLLEQTLRRYQRYEVLTTQLKQTARNLNDPVEYDQVVQAILRSIKPFYSSPM